MNELDEAHPGSDGGSGEKGVELETQIGVGWRPTRKLCAHKLAMNDVNDVFKAIGTA